MTPKPAHADGAPAPLPALAALRAACGLHVLVALLAPSGALAARVSVQLAFLLFLAGFSATYAHARARCVPRQWYAARFAALWPLYAVAILVHVLAFAETDRPWLKALGAVLGVAPLLPQRWQFASTDAPLPLQMLVPCLALAYLVFPVVLDVLPRFDTPHRMHLICMLVAVWVSTTTQAFWLSHLPNRYDGGRSTMLVDVAVYVPFSTSLSAFVGGMVLGLLFLSQKHSTSPLHRLSPIIRRSYRRVLAAFIVLLFCVFAVPIPATAPSGELDVSSFWANWTLSGLLLPVFGVLVWACAAFSDTRTSETGHASVSNASATPSRACFASSDLIRHASGLGYTLYALQAPVLRSLSYALCHRAASASQHTALTSSGPKKLHTFVCMLDAHPRSHGLASWPAWWPWANSSTTSVVPTVSEIAIAGSRVHPVVYLPILLSVAVAVYYRVQVPLRAVICGLETHLSTAREDASWPPSSMFSGSVSKTDLPRRNNGTAERTGRVLVYYTGMALFLVGVFRLSRPIAFHLAHAKHNPLLCWLPASVYNCDSTNAAGPSSHSVSSFGLISKLGIHSDPFVFFVDIFRWISLLTLPTMLFNIAGHIAFPRAIWKRIPSMSELLQRAAIRAGHSADDEEAPVADVEPTVISASSNRLPLDVDFVLYMRYVTRGNNPRLVARNAKYAAEVLGASGLPQSSWRVEVVTDNALDLEKKVSNPAVYELVVPDSYVPPSGALYKARALNYAISASPARDMDWIVHLDEETRFDTDTINAIMEHCGTQNYAVRVGKTQEWPSIGQGPIVYGRALTNPSVAGGGDSGNWLTTLADSGRVSDDCGRYRTQFECGEVWVGMHGSFVVAANCVEREVTFDHGVEGSIAEDAFFAMLARSRKVRFAWIDALMFEQSPFTITDFIKQRSRWLVGGVQVVGSPRIPMHVRSGMAVLTGLWTLMPFTYASLVIAVLFGSGDLGSPQDYWYYHILLPLMAAVSLWSYFFGFFVTFTIRRLGIIRFATLLYIQMIMSPLFGIMEVSAVTYALWNFSKLSVGFHVVDKDSPASANEQNSQTHKPSPGSPTSLLEGERTRLLSL